MHRQEEAAKAKMKAMHDK